MDGTKVVDGERMLGGWEVVGVGGLRVGILEVG